MTDSTPTAQPPVSEENKKTQSEAAPPTNAEPHQETDPEKLQEMIQKQVEFYFSDSNLPRDKFMRSQVALHPEGYVSISIIKDFNRMKALTTDEDVVVGALRNSSKLQVSEDGKMVRRKESLPEEDLSIPRSIVVKKIPGNPSLDELIKFFSTFGKVACVRKETDKKTKLFWGKVFVEFESEEEAKKAFEEATTYEGQETVRMTKASWIEKKKKEKEEWKTKKQQEKEQKSKEQAEKAKRSVVDVPGRLVKLDNCHAELTQDKLREEFAKYGTVKFVDFTTGNTSGYVRFDTPDQAAQAIKGYTEAKTELCGQVLQVSLVTGDDEVSYFENIDKKSSKKRPHGKQQRGRGGKKARRC